MVSVEYAYTGSGLPLGQRTFQTAGIDLLSTQFCPTFSIPKILSAFLL